MSGKDAALFVGVLVACWCGQALTVFMVLIAANVLLVGRVASRRVYHKNELAAVWISCVLFGTVIAHVLPHSVLASSLLLGWWACYILYLYQENWGTRRASGLRR